MFLSVHRTDDDDAGGQVNIQHGSGLSGEMQTASEVSFRILLSVNCGLNNVDLFELPRATFFRVNQNSKSKNVFLSDVK